MIEIRAYEESDGADVIELWGEAFPNPAPRNDPMASIRRKLSVQREWFFVAVEGDVVVGTAMGGYDGHRGWVYSVAVRRSYRRRGIGSRLMARVESALLAAGCVKLNLQVVESNSDVVSFYEGLGYSVEPRISMGKVLSGD